MNESPGQSTLLFLPSKPLAFDPAARDEISRISGLDPFDVRQRCGSGRPAVLIRSADDAALALPCQRLREAGHGAVVIPDREIRRQAGPLDARTVRSTPGGIEFLDEDGRALALLPPDAELLLIVTHLQHSGETLVPMTPGDPSRYLSARLYDEASNEFARLLSAGREGLLIDLAWSGGPDRLRIRADRLRFEARDGGAPGLSAARSLRHVIEEMILGRPRVLLDLDFGRFQPPRLAPGPSGRGDHLPRVEPASEQEAAFESYSRYVTAAWSKGLYEPGRVNAAPPPGIPWQLTRTGLPGLPPGTEPPPTSEEIWLPPTSEPPPDPRSPGELARRIGPPRLIVPLAVAGAWTLSLVVFGHHRELWPLPLLLLAAGLLVHGLALVDRRRRIENVPTSRIRSAAVGLCEIQGKAKPGPEPLRTPFSLMPCVYYEYRLVLEPDSESRTDTRSLAQWVFGPNTGSGRDRADVRTGHSGHLPFFVEDETGRIEVDPRGAIVDVSSTQTLNHIPFAGGVLPPGFRATAWEKYIPVDYPLYVMGELRVEGRDVEAERHDLMARIQAVKRNPARMAAGDRNGDGIVDAGEWEDLVRDLRRQWDGAGNSAATRTDRVTVGRTATTPFFYISEKSEKDVVRAFRWRAMAVLTLGLLLATLAIVRLQPLLFGSHGRNG